MEQLSAFARVLVALALCIACGPEGTTLAKPDYSITVIPPGFLKVDSEGASNLHGIEGSLAEAAVDFDDFQSTPDHPAVDLSEPQGDVAFGGRVDGGNFNPSVQETTTPTTLRPYGVKDDDDTAFGPMVSFGRYMADAGFADRIFVGQCSKGGASVNSDLLGAMGDRIDDLWDLWDAAVGVGTGAMIFFFLASGDAAAAASYSANVKARTAAFKAAHPEFANAAVVLVELSDGIADTLDPGEAAELRAQMLSWKADGPDDNESRYILPTNAHGVDDPENDTGEVVTGIIQSGIHGTTAESVEGGRRLFLIFRRHIATRYLVSEL